MNTEISSKVTLWVNRGIALAVGLMLFLLSWVLRLYSQWRSLEPSAQTAIFVAYYGCAGVVLFAQWHIEKLLKNAESFGVSGQIKERWHPLPQADIER